MGFKALKALACARDLPIEFRTRSQFDKVNLRTTVLVGKYKKSTG